MLTSYDVFIHGRLLMMSLLSEPPAAAHAAQMTMAMAKKTSMIAGI